MIRARPMFADQPFESGRGENPQFDTFAVEQSFPRQIFPFIPEPVGQRNTETAFFPPVQSGRQIFGKGITSDPLAETALFLI